MHRNNVTLTANKNVSGQQTWVSRL